MENVQYFNYLRNLIKVIRGANVKSYPGLSQ